LLIFFYFIEFIMLPLAFTLPLFVLRLKKYEPFLCVLLLCIALPNVLSAQADANIALPKLKIKTLTNKGNITITRLNQLNSALNERNISLTPDGRLMFFLSDRGGQVWSRHPDSTERFDGDIWYSERVNGAWQEPKCLDSTVNTLRGEDEPNISPDGHTVIFESWREGWREKGGPYWTAQLSGTNRASWTNVTGIGGGINLFFSEMRRKYKEQYATDGAAFSPNGRIFVVAC
jgi:Tol biopolymer transport system component